MLLIEHFTSGRLPGLMGGESLRSSLSECLMCTPMRVTKKLSSTHAIGKCCFKKQGSLSPLERAELDESRRAFLQSVEQRPGPGGPGGAAQKATAGAAQTRLWRHSLPSMRVARAEAALTSSSRPARH